MPRASSVEEQYAKLSPFFQGQQRTFVMWANQKLMDGGEEPVPTGAAASTAFCDGSVVAKMLQCLTGERIRGIEYNKSRLQSPLVVSANWSILFKFMAKEKIETGGITGLLLSQANQKTVMALLWRFIQKYDLSDAVDFSSIDGLLKWVQPRTEQWYPGVKNFTSNWKDGVAYLALYDSIFPGEINMEEVDHSAHHENLQRAFDLFEKNLGVSQMLRPEDVTGKNETKKQNVTYIIQIKNAAMKKEEDDERLKKLREEEERDIDGKRRAENAEHNTNGDRLYKEGVTKMNGTNTGAEEKINEIMTDTFPGKCLAIGGDQDIEEMDITFEELCNHALQEGVSPTDVNDCTTKTEVLQYMPHEWVVPGQPPKKSLDEEYDSIIEECISELEEVLGGFDQAKDKFDAAEAEFKLIVPPSDFDPTPEEKIDNCEKRRVQCDELREKYKLELTRRLDDAIRNDRGEKKYKEGSEKHKENEYEGGKIITKIVEELSEQFSKTNSEEQREPLALAAEKRVSDAADDLFDPVKITVMEAEELLDSTDRKADCRRLLDEIDASKAQMLETIRLKIAELKAEHGQNDELTPEELLQMYHATSNKIASLIENRAVVDEGIPSDPKEIRERLAKIIDEVNNIFGSKDTLRAKVHATEDWVFDVNGLP